MTNKYQRIEDFLHFIADIAKENPNLEINKDLVYHELTRLGVSKEDKHKRIKHHFQTWINHFANDKNCQVYVDENWKYFCQFVSDDSLKFYSDHIKIYVPLDSEHVEKGVESIFEFLSKNNISHLSKVGSDIRFDDVVIRLVNPSDAEKLLSFLKNNKYIQEGLLPANPFVFNQDGIPMAVDGKLSFNSTLAKLISIYINECKSKGDLNSITVKDFYEFLNHYSNSRFNNFDGLIRLAQDFEIAIDSEKAANYYNVITMMQRVNNLNYSYEDYMNHYRACADLKFLAEQKQAFDNIIIEGQKQLNSNSQSSFIETEKKVLTLMKELIDTMARKYGFETAKNNIIFYVQRNDINRITRDNNLRERVYNSSFREDLLKILSIRETNLVDYLNGFENQLIMSKKEEYLRQAILETYTKKNIEYQESKNAYTGEAYVKQALTELIRYRYYNAFTRDNNARENLINNVMPEEVLNIIKKHFNIDQNAIITEQDLETIIYEYVNSVLNYTQEMKR